MLDLNPFIRGDYCFLLQCYICQNLAYASDLLRLIWMVYTRQVVKK